jgi:hypothetical protein
VELLRTADVQFKEALNREGEGHGAGLFVDYAHYLCTCERHGDAIPHIMKVISLEKDKPESINYYGRMESFTLDSYLQKEIATYGGIELLSVVFAYYFRGARTCRGSGHNPQTVLRHDLRLRGLGLP